MSHNQTLNFNPCCNGSANQIKAGLRKSHNQKLIFNPKTNVTEIIEVESNVELSWRNGILNFDSTPMAKVEKTIERWYGINLVIDNNDLYHTTFTGTHQNKNLKSVIEALTYATGSKYTVKNNSIIIN